MRTEQRWSDNDGGRSGKRRSRYASRGADEEIIIDEPDGIIVVCISPKICLQ